MTGVAEVQTLSIRVIEKTSESISWGAVQECEFRPVFAVLLTEAGETLVEKRNPSITSE